MALYQDRGAENEDLARQRVRRYTRRVWVDGGLHHRLDGTVSLATPLRERPNAVDRGWLSDAGRRGAGPEAAARPPRGVAEWAEEYGGRLLILGEPGAGKSTQLLHLAEDLLDSEEPEDRARCPVVLLLSTWQPQTGSFDRWLVAELREHYQIAATLTDRWLRDGTLTVLLDGLDEVPEEGRARCLEALNTFLRDADFADVRIAVTCRSTEYDHLPARLALEGAVSLAPVEVAEAQRAFRAAGAALDPLRRQTERNAEVAAVFRTPLMVVLAVLAYRDRATALPLPTGDAAQVRKEILRLYVVSMLYRHRVLARAEPGSSAIGERGFSPSETYCYLAHLARLMTRRGSRLRTLLYVDELTPEWLPRIGEESYLPQGRPTGWFGRFTARVGLDHASTGSTGGVLATCFFAVFVAPLSVYAWGLLPGLLSAVPLSLAVGLLVFTLFGVTRMQPFGRDVVFFLDDEASVPRAATRWTWVAARAARWVLPAAMGAGACGLVVGVSTTAVSGLVVALTILVGGLLGLGLVPDYRREPDYPGEALTVSGRVLRTLLLAAVALGGVESAAYALAGWPWQACLAAVPMSTCLFMVTGPGRAWLRTRALTFGGSRSGLLPSRLGPFLEHATERALLRRAGGGYAYAHDALQEFFVHADPGAVPEEPAGGRPVV
ncbi:NACHT domain-containing protein [Streptomyces sp. NPDC027717]|uniref:NACHT domain-containing protein n=1 Tax=Streptomyces sp. NPDC027717 TaxID=3155765 RepID=UPI0033F4A08B